MPAIIMGRKKLLSSERVLVEIQAWIVKNGIPPTLEELRRSLNLGSTRTAYRYVAELAKNGFIERWKGARGMRLLKAPNIGEQTGRVPLIGRAPAGPLMVAEQNIEGWLRIPKALLRPESSKFYLLRVVGDSMDQAHVEGEQIEDGDLVLVQRQAGADLGQVVVALVDGEATIKRLARGSGYYFLKPESSKKHEPIIINREASMQGIVRRVIKKGSKLLGSMGD